MRYLVLALALALAPGCRRESATDHMQRARDATFEKRPDEALVEYRKALDALRVDDSPQAVVLKARALKGAADVYWLELRKVKEAVSVYKELITQCPESPEALEARVVLAELLRVYFRDLRGAIDQLTAALARNPHLRLVDDVPHAGAGPDPEVNVQLGATGSEKGRTR